MEPTFCSNENCILHTRHTGGKFRMIQGKWYCYDCAPEVMPGTARNLWDFTTTHFDGNRVHVKNLAHLRQLEKKFGVSNQLANNMERNCK
jgi:hypothetical protein